MWIGIIYFIDFIKDNKNLIIWVFKAKHNFLKLKQDNKTYLPKNSTLKLVYEIVSRKEKNAKVKKFMQWLTFYFNILALITDPLDPAKKVLP